MLTPFRLQKRPFIVVKNPLVVHVTSVGPPRAAFSEIFDEQKRSDFFQNETPKTSIDLNEVNEQRKTWAPLQEIGARKIILQPLHIERNLALAEAQEEVQDRQWIESLSPAQKNRLVLAEQEHQVLDQDWSPAPFRVLAQKKIEDIKKQEQSAGRQKSPIYIAAIGSDGRIQTPEDLKPASVEVRDPELKKILYGKIRLEEGVAMGDRTLEIHRYEEGVAKDVGSVDFKTAKFSIEIGNASGVLRAELFDHNGQVVAMGSSRLTSPLESGEILISLKPRTTLAGHFYNYNKLPSNLAAKSIPVTKSLRPRVLVASLDEEVAVDELGTFQVNNVVEDSWTLVRAEQQGFRSCLQLVPAGRESKIPLFQEAFAKAAYELAQENQTVSSAAETGSVLWGQVLLDGKPVSGVKIELEADPDLQPLYLNGWVPDASLEGTSENGFFMFANVPKGFNSLKATRGGRMISHANVVTEEGSFSSVVLEETLRSEKAMVKVFDAFSGQPVVAEVTFQSFEEPLRIDGFASVRLPLVSRLSLAEITEAPPEYVPARYVYMDTDDHLHFPLVSQAWLTRILTERKVTYIPDTAVVIGFVLGENFVAYLPHDKEYSMENIVYFDASGNVVDQGVAGGGFVMFNVPTGPQSVVTLSEKTGLAHSQVVPADASTTSVLRFHF